MRKRKLIVVAVGVGIAAFCAAIGVSLLLARQQGQEDAGAYLQGLATDVLRRSDGTLMQAQQALATLEANPVDVPCSLAHRDVMNRVAARAGYLQGVGYLENNTLLCSTLSPMEGPVSLGKPGRETSTGLQAWSGIRLPEIPDVPFNINARDHYAVIIAPDLVFNTVGDDTGVTLVQINTTNNNVMRHRGDFDPAWFARFPRQAAVFFEDGHLIATQTARGGETLALAAMPVAGVWPYIVAAMWRLVPIGALMGMLFAGLVYGMARHRMSFKAELQNALKNKEFFLMYQPVVSLETGRCTGAEALIRWHRNEGPAISPAVFIPQAEAHGLIQQVTAQVMEMVAADAVTLIKNHPDTHIAINFSAEDLHSPETEARLKTLIQSVGAGSHNILIEATERGLMSPEKARGVLVSVRSQGFKVAIDDFGTGNSSLSYLATYDLDYLKIDKSFVDALATPQDTSPILFHIIAMARSLGLQMIAEGVETEMQRDMLRDAGVQFAQGWFFAKPMSMKDLAEFVRSSNAPVPA